MLVLAPLFIWAMSSAAIGYVRGPRAGRPARLWLASRTVTALGSVLMLVTLGVWGARFFGYFGGPVQVETLSDWSRARTVSSGRTASSGVHPRTAGVKPAGPTSVFGGFTPAPAGVNPAGPHLCLRGFHTRTR